VYLSVTVITSQLVFVIYNFPFSRNFAHSTLTSVLNQIKLTNFCRFPADFGRQCLDVSTRRHIWESGKKQRPVFKSVIDSKIDSHIHPCQIFAKKAKAYPSEVPYYNIQLPYRNMLVCLSLSVTSTLKYLPAWQAYPKGGVS
jgi:hypothetical protein